MLILRGKMTLRLKDYSKWRRVFHFQSYNPLNLINMFFLGKHIPLCSYENKTKMAYTSQSNQSHLQLSNTSQYLKHVYRVEYHHNHLPLTPQN